MTTLPKRGSFTVERRAVLPALEATRGSLSLTKLPVPPAARGVSPHGGGSRGACCFRAWRAAASWRARLQEPKRVRGPVAISITVEEGASRNDLAGLAKAPIDLLCELQLIEADDRHVIREVTLRWDAIEGLRIDVRPAT